MTEDTIISVEGLGKKYRLGTQRNERYTALRDVLTEKARSFFRRPNNRLTDNESTALAREEFWALKDVSFEVKRGEVVGIVGRNGAGKSTLLKILSRITEPTEGKVRIKGRVASLLEVGTGFHPELTGRENIFLNGAILGMSRVEIKKKFDEIVAFAEVEKFLDTPVKRYSSGMYVRLAFAVAAHLEPEILVIDEVLAVGDAEFQKKCLRKMHEVSGGGRTVLFVSHNIAAVQALCPTGILLIQGQLKFRGAAQATIARYLESNSSPRADVRSRTLSKSLAITRFECGPGVIEQHHSSTIHVELAAHHTEVITDLALLIHAANGERVALIDLRSESGPYRISAGQKLALQTEVTNIPFVEGDYNVGLYVSAGSVRESFMDLLTITVVPDSSNGGIVSRDPQFRGLVELHSRVQHQIC